MACSDGKEKSQLQANDWQKIYEEYKNNRTTNGFSHRSKMGLKAHMHWNVICS